MEAKDREIEELRLEIDRLNKIVRELTEAVKVLTEADERARAFIARIEELTR